MSQDSDEQLQRALGRALHTHSTDQVDGEALLAGAQRGARRRRTGRRSVAALAVAGVIALPAGYLWSQQGDTTTVVVPATATVTSQTPTAPTNTSTYTGTTNEYPIPEAAGLQQSDLAQLERSYFEPNYRRIGIVPGAECNLDRPGSQPVAGSMSTWIDPTTSFPNQYTVQVNITGFLRGQGETAFDEVAGGNAECRFDQTFAARTSTAGDPMLYANKGADEWVVVRVNDLLVAVEVIDGGDERLGQAQALAETVAQRLKDQGVTGSTP